MSKNESLQSSPSRAAFTAFDLTLYGITVVVWTFSWLAIHYQVGPVPAEVSVVWRFALAAPIMMVLARLNGQSLAYPAAEHVRFVALGIFLFSTSFVLFYQAAAYIASGLMCVVFSLASMVNVFLGAIVLRAPIDRRIVVAGVIGTVGVALLFYPEIAGNTINDDALAGLGLSLLGDAVLLRRQHDLGPHATTAHTGLRGERLGHVLRHCLPGGRRLRARTAVHHRSRSDVYRRGDLSGGVRDRDRLRRAISRCSAASAPIGPPTPWWSRRRPP